MQNVSEIASINHYPGPWRRIGMLLRYYAVRMRMPLILFPIISLCLGLLLFIPGNENAMIPDAMVLLVFTVIPYWFALGPLVFTIGGDSRAIDRLMPARTAEKFFAQILIILVVIPILVYTLPLLCLYLRTYLLHFAETEMLAAVYSRFSMPSNLFVGVAENLCTVALVYFTVTTVNRNRVLLSVVALIAFQFFCGIIGAVYGIVRTFSAGFYDGYTGAAPKNLSAVELVESLNLNLLFVITGISCAIAAVVLFTLAYRKLSRKQL